LVVVTASGPSHSAAASALGYLYQSQWPLVELLRRGRDEPDSAVTLELYDDVAWDEEGTPSELLQWERDRRPRSTRCRDPGCRSSATP
jgi:hypothetical protein